jgi:hypothetical protein
MPDRGDEVKMCQYSALSEKSREQQRFREPLARG